MVLKTSILLILFQLTLQGFSQKVAIDKKEYVIIGGIEQWITITGEDLNNPVILFLHGGPGSVMSPFNDNIYGEWKKDYVLVNWDQRGAGRTFGRNAPEEIDEKFWIENELTLAQMVRDGIELTEYLTKYLNVEKVFLIGTSWGSILGTKMALSRPDLYFAYLGHAQFVNFTENIKYAYSKILELAEISADSTLVATLSSLGKPPYKDAGILGQLLRLIRNYEIKYLTPAPDEWWVISPEYNNEVDHLNRYNGDDYSFLYFAGHEKMGIKSIAEDLNFNEEGIKFNIPVYLIQGEYDILTSSEINKPYFNKISAPDKAYYLLPDAGHGLNRSVVKLQYQILEKLKF